MAVTADGRNRAGLDIGDGDDVTRYLCAGAHLDQGFAWDVVDEVLLERARGVAPAPGADVGAVAAHSLAAVRRATTRDLLLTLIVAGVAVLAGLQGILIAVWIFSWALIARAARSLARGETGPAFSQFGVFLLVSIGCLLGLVLRPGGPRFGAGGLSVDLPLQSTQVLGLVIAALWLVNYLDRIARYGVLAEQLSRGRFGHAPLPATGARWDDRLAYIRAASGSALSVYAQNSPNAPFTGFGPVVHTWSVAVRLESGDRPRPDGEPRSTSGLGGAQLSAALLDAGPAAGFAAAELVLSPGWLRPGHPFLEPVTHRPVPAIAPGVVREIARHPAGPESFQVVWSSAAPAAGSVACAFVHVSVRDDRVTVETAFTVLPPVDESFRAADRLGPATLLTVARTLGSAFIDVGRRTPQAPVNLIRTLARLWARRPAGPVSSPAGGGIGGPSPPAGRAAGAGADHGARTGVRELAARRSGRDAAAGADYEATRQVNLLSRELTGVIARELSSHDHDPTEFLRAADGVWQKPLGTGQHRGMQVPAS